MRQSLEAMPDVKKLFLRIPECYPIKFSILPLVPTNHLIFITKKNLSGKPAINRSCTVSFLPPLIIFKIEACHAQRLYSLISLHYPCSSTYRYNLISLF